MMNIYKYNDYRTYILDKYKKIMGSSRGVITQLAAQIACGPSYMTQVLKHKTADLSLEQAFRLNLFFQHNKKESDYFLKLVQYERAGTVELKNYFMQEVKELQKKHNNLSTKIGVNPQNTLTLQEGLFSFWYQAAIYTALNIPELNTPTTLAKKLNLDLNVVIETIENLTKIGLVCREQNGYKGIRRAIHLPHNAKAIIGHHINWRLRSLSKLQTGINEDDLFYSSVIALSLKSYKKITEVLSTAIKESKKIVQEGKEETLASFNLDLFTL